MAVVRAGARSAPGADLERHIGPWGLLLTGVTGIIGSGWLFAALYAAQIAGPAAVISWLIGSALVLTLAFIYAELGGMIPAAGALARIPYVALGPLGGFVGGWLCWIAYVAVVSIEVTAVLSYASNYFPSLTEMSDGSKILSIEGIAIAAVLIAVLTAINIAGVKWMVRSTVLIAVWKLAVPALVAVMLIIAGFQAANFTEFGGFAPHGLSGILGAVSSGGVIFSLIGFRAVLDLAGEARNPSRDVPLAIVGSVLICLVVYVLLQVAFIGAVPAAHLSGGWTGLVENFTAGPFAGLAALLGLQYVAMLVYFDAVVSPGGTALAYVGTSGRLNYSMAELKLFPAIFMRLNRYRVPAVAMVFNSALGIFILAPLPGWPQLAGFISSAAVLSLAIGPIALVALRHQAPDHARPFRLRAAVPVAALAFIFVGFIVYWSGWDTNWKILLILLVGLAYLVARSAMGRTGEPLYFAHAWWLIAYYAAMGVISWLGNFGGGLGVIPAGLDMAAIAVVSLAVFWLAIRTELPPGVAQRLIGEAEAHPSSAP
ncbi:MAG: APC family permease [Rhizobiales bacterium]|nr:APC family permease [Hyphomicrobiales bacterium]